MFERQRIHVMSIGRHSCHVERQRIHVMSDLIGSHVMPELIDPPIPHTACHVGVDRPPYTAHTFFRYLPVRIDPLHHIQSLWISPYTKRQGPLYRTQSLSICPYTDRTPITHRVCLDTKDISVCLSPWTFNSCVQSH